MKITEELLPVKYRGQTVLISANVRSTGNDLIVFLHGIGCSKESFDGAFTANSLGRFSICTFDFPGHGQSSKLDQPLYSLQSYADITNLVIDRLSYERVFMACHSMGGAVGLIATEGRHDIAYVVSADGNLIGHDCGLVSRRIAAQPLDAFIRKGFSQLLSGLQASQRKDFAAWAEWCARTDPVALHEAARSLVEWSDNGKLLKLFNALEPKAYLHGDEDDKQYLLPVLKNARVHRISGSGHFMMIDNPSDFYSLLADIFTST